MEVKGITIHNTGNDLSAREVYKLLEKNKNRNYCHFLVDENEVINCFPTSQPASHTGKGYDFGNMYTIAIEICRSRSDLETYMKAQERAIGKIKELMEEYHLTKDDIYFHSDFNAVRCPHRIFEIYKTKGDFINECFI